MKSQQSRSYTESRLGGKDTGTLDLERGRDRNSTFEPIILEKRQTTIGADLDGKIISMYSRGMRYSDIQEHLLELYCNCKFGCI